MAFAELDIAPRTRGRVAKTLRIEGAGELTPADLQLLNAERGTKPVPIKELRDRHHNLARLLASGVKPFEAAIITGYSVSRISILKGDPQFQALMEDYRSQGDAAQADFVERTSALSTAVVARLHDLVEDDEDLSPTMLLEIGKFAADRTGNAPTSKTLNVNMNVGLGTRMTEARERMRQLRIVSSETLPGEADGD